MKSFAKSRIGKIIALVLTVCLLGQVCATGVFAFGGYGKKAPYEKVVIYGDSLCLGFNTIVSSMTDGNSFDITANATQNRYPWSYPSVFCEMIGLDPYSSDLRNYGICAAWTQDMYEMLTDPFYYYSYSQTTDLAYDEDDTFVLPYDYVGERQLVNMADPDYDVTDPGTWEYRYTAIDYDAPGFDPENPDTWVVLSGEKDWVWFISLAYDYWTGQSYYVTYMKTEEYTVPAGTEIKVASWTDNGYGLQFTLNNIISEQYFWVEPEGYDANGNLLDNNGDGVIDNLDPTYVPATFDWTTYQYVPESATAVRNPMFTKYYYNDMVRDAQSADLILLAIGGNDIYHSFMPYQNESGSMLGDLFATFGNFFMNGMTVGDILDMFDGMSMEDLANMAVAAGIPATEEELDTKEAFLDEGPALGEGEGYGEGEMPEFDMLSEIKALLEYYSEENVNAYMKDVIANYKYYYTKTVQRLRQLNPCAEIGLVGNFNPFGMKNYLNMLALELEDGELYEQLKNHSEVLAATLKAIIGSPEDYDKIFAMSEEELNDAILVAGNELENLLALFDDPDFDKKFSTMVERLSFPLAVVVVGNSLKGVYEEMNCFLENLVSCSDDKHLDLIDISNAPSNGRFDPHPGELGHKWIAQKLYETLVPSVEAYAVYEGTGDGTIRAICNPTPALHDDVTYKITPAFGSKISAIFVDGVELDKCQYKCVYETGLYTFKNLVGRHTLAVQFDDCNDKAVKHVVNVIGSYTTESGEGIYNAGHLVTVDAGSVEGYEFVCWLTDDCRLFDENSAKTSFVMPFADVNLTAVWRPVGEEGEVRNYTLTFESNGGTPFDNQFLPEGSVVDLSTFVPEREGYTFLGWCYDADLTTTVKSVTMYTNNTVYAKWVENCLLWKMHPTIIASISKQSTGSGVISSLGTSILDFHDFKEYRIVPSAGSRIGAVFVDGIYLNPIFPENAVVYNSGSYVFEDVTRNHTITVVFDDNCGKQVERNLVQVLGSYAVTGAGEGLYEPGMIVVLDAGELDGYVFAGWEVEGARVFDPSSPKTAFIMPDHEVRAVATWVPLFNVYFETYGGSPVATYTAIKGTVLDLTDITSVKDGYRFLGWSLEPNGKIVTSVVMTSDLILYANWEKIENPGTADSMIGVWAVLGCVTLAGTCALVVARKKEND